jgi:hypothetical protein
MAATPLSLFGPMPAWSQSISLSLRVLNVLSARETNGTCRLDFSPFQMPHELAKDHPYPLSTASEPLGPEVPPCARRPPGAAPGPWVSARVGITPWRQEIQRTQLAEGHGALLSFPAPRCRGLSRPSLASSSSLDLLPERPQSSPGLWLGLYANVWFLSPDS